MEEDKVEEKNIHYFCPGSCGAVSENEQPCGTSGCSDYGNTMKKCECTDGNHKSATSGGWI